MSVVDFGAVGLYVASAWCFEGPWTFVSITSVPGTEFGFCLPCSHQNSVHIGGVRAEMLFLSHSGCVLCWAVSATESCFASLPLLFIIPGVSGIRFRFRLAWLDPEFLLSSARSRCMVGLSLFVVRCALFVGRCCKFWFWIVSTSPSRGNHG